MPRINFYRASFCGLILFVLVSACGGGKKAVLNDSLISPDIQNFNYNIPNAEGQLANPLLLKTEAGQSYSLYDVEAEHTILFFYDPACLRCGAVTAALHRLYSQYKEKGLEVYAVYTGQEQLSWIEWLYEGGFTDWINVWDSEKNGTIFKQYPINGLPFIYILDKDKRIESADLSFQSLYVIVTELMFEDNQK